MQAASPLPSTGEVFLDARGDDRALRVSWHAEAAVVVLSLWKDGTCAGSFRLAVEDVPGLVEVLRGGLQGAYDRHKSLLEQAFSADLTG
ncbi:MAG: hypothetical protein ACXVW0_13375 [Nocardioides sp.]